MSRNNIDIPIFAITSSVATQRKVALYRNVRTLGVVPSNDIEEVLKATEELLLAKGIVQKGDLIVVTSGDPMGQVGGTNALKIMRIGGR